jgi:RimJ/RimL family protein N-acetyltransferase
MVVRLSPSFPPIPSFPQPPLLLSTITTSSFHQKFRLLREENSSKPAKKSIEESKQWMIDYILPTPETHDIDKFALLLKDSGNEKGELKMIGFVGTNRWCEQGMDVGYCMNISYWGHGYATEGMRAFLKLFWELPGLCLPLLLPALVHFISTLLGG